MELKNEKTEEVIVDSTLDFMNKNLKSKYSSYYFGKVRTKKDIVPYFELSKEINGMIKTVTYSPPLQRISGKLNNIEFTQGEFQGSPIYSVVFKFETLTESNSLVGIRVSCSRNQALLNWLNCLIGFNEEITSFEISLWKDKNTGYNKSTCKINGKKPNWAFTLDQMEEKKEKILDKKGVLLMTKTDELFDFMEEELKKKLDILLPNRYKEEESNKFEDFIPTDEQPVGETNVDEYTPTFEEEAIDEFFDGKKKK
jgi:hypothetical protein